jgi:hypothetical protein
LFLILEILAHLRLSSSLGNIKIPFSDLNDLLLSIKPFGSIFNVLLPGEVHLLQELFEQTLGLNDAAEFIIHRAAMPKIKRARSLPQPSLLLHFLDSFSLNSRLTRVAVDEINSLLTKINHHPVAIFGANDIKVLLNFFPYSSLSQSASVSRRFEMWGRVGKMKHLVFVLMVHP